MATPDKTEASAGEMWWVNRGGETYGPYERDWMLDNIKNGSLVSSDLVWSPSLGEWSSLENIAALFPELAEPKAPQTDARPAPQKTGFLFRFIRMFMIVLNPGGLLKSHLKSYSWVWAISVSGLAFMLFFIQTSLDLHRAGEAGGGHVVGMAFTGILYGTLGISLFALVAWILVGAWRKKYTAAWSVKAFGLGYAPALVYTTSGLLANLFLGWNTSLSFGIPGVLWATMPMMAALREMTGDKKLVSLLITLCFGLLVFMSWSLLIGRG